MKARKIAYQKTLFMLLVATRVMSEMDYNIPLKWYALIDSMTVSSQVLHNRIAFIDPNVERQFREKELQLERQLGKRKFYDEEEIVELKDKMRKIRLES